MECAATACDICDTSNRYFGIDQKTSSAKGCAPYAALRTGRAQKEAKAAPLLTLFAAGSRQAPLQSLPLHRPPTAALD